VLARKVVEETSRGLSVGLKGSTLKVTDGKTNWGGDLNEMTSYGNLMTARRSLLSEFDMNSDSGRALDMGFMQMQAAQMRQMTQTPIEESAAYLQGMARGEAHYNHINRDRIAQQQRQVQTTRQLDTLNNQTWQADQARAKMTTLEKVQLGFDIAGMTEIPGVSQIAELGSAGISLYNGDYVGAGLGVASMIPIAGKWAESAKMQRLTERVQSYSGANSDVNFSRIAPGGGLQSHENAGGHLLQKHVGQSEQALLLRLAAEPKISGSSSFYNREVAENVVSQMLDSNNTKIVDWLNGSGGRLRLDQTFSDLTGISVSRGAQSAVDVGSARVILVRDPSMSTGFKILTGFPTKP
jgi:hypothetical protein